MDLAVVAVVAVVSLQVNSAIRDTSCDFPLEFSLEQRIILFNKYFSKMAVCDLREIWLPFFVGLFVYSRLRRKC